MTDIGSLGPVRLPFQFGRASPRERFRRAAENAADHVRATADPELAVLVERSRARPVFAAPRRRRKK